MTGLKDDPFAIAPVLGVLDDADRRYLAERSRRRTIDKGQILFTEGDVSDSVVVLIAGHMKVLVYSKDGGEFIVNTVAPGETIGEVGVLSNGPRSATVQATEESVVLSLPGSVIIDLIRQAAGARHRPPAAPVGHGAPDHRGGNRAGVPGPEAAGGTVPPAAQHPRVLRRPIRH